MPQVKIHLKNGSTLTFGKSRVERVRGLFPTLDRASKAQQIDDLASRMAAALEELMGWAKEKTKDAFGAEAVDVFALHDVHADRLARRRARDEDLGHEFHGNQWTGGLGSAGPKPTTVKAKAAKAGIHELLSSGHPFTKQELMAVTGVKTEKLFSDYIAMLKNPKYAGPAGALQIVKQGDHYAVATKAATESMTEKLDAIGEALKPNEVDGSWIKDVLDKPSEVDALASLAAEHAAAPVPAAQKKLMDDWAKEGNTAALESVALAHADTNPHIAAHAKGLLAAQKAPSSAPAPAPAATPAPVTAETLPTPKTKAEADKDYELSVTEAQLDLEQAIKGGATYDAVIPFKQAKADAMAKWATAVKGAPYQPKKVDAKVYAADKQLADDLVGVKNVGETKAAFAQWKANTSLEKQGLFPPPKPQPAIGPNAASVIPATYAAQAKQAAEVAPTLGGPAPVQTVAYDAIVPASHEHISAADIHHGEFQKGILGFKNDLVKQSAATAQDNKKGVEFTLRDRLKDSPNFQALKKTLGMASEGYGSLESKLIQAWAGSSGDSHPISVAQQLAVRDAFSMPHEHVETKALKLLANTAEDAVLVQAMKDLNYNVKVTEKDAPTIRAGLQEFVRAQYDSTQAMLKAQGRDHVFLARGMKVQSNNHAAHGAVGLKLQPASSFSTSYSTAKAFAGGSGTVFVVKVPASQVLSTYVTGFGCTGEHEVVVLAHKDTQAFSVKSGAASSAAVASEHIKSELAQHPSYVPPPKKKPQSKAPAKAAQAPPINPELLGAMGLPATAGIVAPKGVSIAGLTQEQAVAKIAKFKAQKKAAMQKFLAKKKGGTT